MMTETESIAEPIDGLPENRLKKTDFKQILASVIPQAPTVLTPEFSVITCSANDRKFNVMSNAYATALAGEAYEIIRISDATGLAEGYLRGLEQASGQYIIFSHDDAAPLRPIGARLRRHLRQVDIVGGAGSDRLDGPAWFTAGPPHVAGQVLNQMMVQTPDGPKIQFLLSVYGIPSRLVTDIQVIDGFWIAANRAALAPDKAWFDPQNFPGFHGYDVDFSFSAFQRGIRVGVACDLSLCHASTGGYADPEWNSHADQLRGKHRTRWSQHRPLTWQFTSVLGEDQQLMLNVMDEFVERINP